MRVQGLMSMVEGILAVMDRRLEGSGLRSLAVLGFRVLVRRCSGRGTSTLRKV